MRKTTLPDVIYYASVYLYFLCGALSNSMISVAFHLQSVLRILQYAAFLGVVCKILFSKKILLKMFLYLSIAMALCIVIWFHMGSNLILFIVIFTLGAEGCSPKKIAKLYVLSVGLVLLFCSAFSLTGVIEDRIFYRLRDGHMIIRHSFGMAYTTIWAAYLFCVCAAYIYIKQKKIKWYDHILLMIAAWITFNYTDTRLETFFLILLSVALLFYQKIIKSRVWDIISVFSFPLSAALIFFLQFLYTINPVFFHFLNAFSSSRFSLTNQVIRDYGFRWLGQNIRFQGWGTVNFDWQFGYYFVDSFYINYTLRYGLIFMILLCLFFPFFFAELKKRKKDWVLFFLLLLCVHGIVISLILVPYVNPFFVIAFAEYRDNSPQFLEKKILRLD